MNIIIILGERLTKTCEMSKNLKLRLDKGINVFEKLKTTETAEIGDFNFIITSGGTGNKKCKQTESSLMRDYLQNNFKSKNTFFIEENESEDTIQNAENCLNIVSFLLSKLDKQVNSITVVSSEYHIKRVKLIFRHVFKEMKSKLKFSFSENAIIGKELEIVKENEKKFYKQLREILK